MSRLTIHGTIGIPSLVLGVLLTFSCAAIAAVPTTINHQGYLTNPAGQPVDGTVTMVFKLYKSDNSEVWTETQTDVPVTKGVYSVLLGSVASLAAIPFDVQYFLGITVGSDTEMSPRQALTSVAYAARAKVADSLSTLPTPVIWSGGCMSHGTSAGWNRYCTDGVDFNTAGSYLTVPADGTITIKIAGYYRISFRTTSLGNTGSGDSSIWYKRNGTIFHIGNETGLTATMAWRERMTDVVWYFGVNDTLAVDVYNPGQYAYHLWNSQGYSRLQITYVGAP